jgi:hypothetical protein
MRHFPLRECCCAIAIVLVFAALYAGAYYATVDRQMVMRNWDPPPKETTAFEPRYSVPMLSRFLTPMHELDRKLRPRYWSIEAMMEDMLERAMKAQQKK